MRHIAYTTKSRMWTTAGISAVSTRKTPFMGELSTVTSVTYRHYVMTS